ncbi:ABC transporter substrate-binding protein [Candidatus Bipolaricaulota bacterium]|nr:ABC transporter substrate-binding protein [Candidatus Bipolaricaulota bacterium]
MKNTGRRLTRRSFLKGVIAGGLSLMAGGLKFHRSYSSSPITIGLQVELTGGLATYGYWHLKSARAAVDRINAEGGIGGRKVKLVHEDTETDPTTGSRKMRRLILKRGADFVIGSQHSGVCLASLPASRRFSVPYFPIGEATEITGSDGHEYVFRLNCSVEAHAEAGYRWVMKNLGPNWTVLYADYAMGQSAVEDWGSRLEASGGRIVDNIAVPQGTDDFGPYLQKVDPEKSDVLVIILYGPDALACLRRSEEMGLNNELALFGNTGSVEALDIDFSGAEGLWSITNYPRCLEGSPVELKDANRAFREMVGVSSDGRGSKGRIVDASHFWVPWEGVNLLKEAMESAGWEGNGDNSRLIEKLEGINIHGSVDYPQGSKYIRAADHQGFHSQYIQRVEDGELEIKTELSPEDSEYEPNAEL